MEKICVTVSMEEERLKALEFALKKKNSSVQRRMDDALRQLYEKEVPEPIREYVDSLLAPPPRAGGEGDKRAGSGYAAGGVTMAYVKENAPSKVYHLTKKEKLNSILEDGRIRRFGDTECWFCTDPQKMKAYMEQTVMCEGKPYYAVGGQLCRYPKFVPEDYIILKLTPCHQKDNWYRWEQEVPAGSPAELVKAAHEFSALKIGYRGDLAFRNAEVIDVPRFLAEGLTQGEPVQTNAELRDALVLLFHQEE